MSFHDPLNVFVYCSNQCDVVPFKNSRKKLNHFIIVLSLVPIQALFKNISRSSPLLPLKIGITMLIFILFCFLLKIKTHQTN